LQGAVHLLGLPAGDFALEMGHVVVPEEELPVEVAHFDAVVVSAPDLTFRTQPEQGLELEEFAT